MSSCAVDDFVHVAGRAWMGLARYWISAAFLLAAASLANPGSYVAMSCAPWGIAVSRLQFPAGGVGCQLGHLLMVMFLDFPCPLGQRASLLFVLH